MDEVTITDSKKNQKAIEGTIEGFVVRKVFYAGLGGYTIGRIDPSWKDKRVLLVLLDKPNV